MNVKREEVEAQQRRGVGVGSKMVGGVVGAMVSLATGAPLIGAALSPFLAHQLERAGNEMIQRRLAPRQDERVGRAIVAAAERIRELQASGRTPRNDGFFGVEGSEERTESDEVTEAALLAAMNSAQERKVNHIGRLLANIAFDASVDASTAHLLLDLAEAVSLRGFVLLKIMQRTDDHGFEPRPLGDGPPAAPHGHTVLTEAYTLYARGLILMKDREADEDSIAVLGQDNIDPARMYLSPLGRKLGQMLEVDLIPNEDPLMQETLAQLKMASGSSAGATFVGRGEF